MVTQGNMRRRISPRGLLLPDTDGWHSPHGSKWPTPAKHQDNYKYLRIWLTKVCVCWLIPVCSVDRWRSLYICQPDRENLFPPQTKRRWCQRKSGHREQKRPCSSQCDGEMRRFQGGGLGYTMLLSPSQVGPASHSTPITTAIKNVLLWSVALWVYIHFSFISINRETF